MPETALIIGGTEQLFRFVEPAIGALEEFAVGEAVDHDILRHVAGIHAVDVIVIKPPVYGCEPILEICEVAIHHRRRFTVVGVHKFG